MNECLVDNHKMCLIKMMLWTFHIDNCQNVSKSVFLLDAIEILKILVFTHLAFTVTLTCHLLAISKFQEWKNYILPFGWSFHMTEVLGSDCDMTHFRQAAILTWHTSGGQRLWHDSLWGAETLTHFRGQWWWHCNSEGRDDHMTLLGDSDDDTTHFSEQWLLEEVVAMGRQAGVSHTNGISWTTLTKPAYE